MRSAERLRAELGRDAITEEPCEALEGVTARARVRPESGEALATAVTVLGEAGACAWPRGAGTRRRLGNLPGPRRPLDDAWVLDTVALDRVDAFEPEEGVLHAGPGAPLAELAALVAAEGWELPIDVDCDRSTLGGAIAAAAHGPRALRFGPPRDHVLGLEMVLAHGARTRCGGRVVKNVTGFDLAKLYAGSLGTLGVIEGAWLRLRPRPHCVRALSLESAGPVDWERAIADARRPCVRAALWLHDGDDHWRALLELAGEEPAVARDAQALGGQQAEASEEGEALDRAWRAVVADDAPRRARLQVLPSRLSAVLERLAPQRARVVVQPGLGRIDLAFDTNASDAGDSLWRAVAAAARAGGGHVVWEAWPVEEKRGRDVFGIEPGPLALMRALKARFDPGELLSPGRMLPEQMA